MQRACAKKTVEAGVNVMKGADSEENEGEYGELYHIWLVILIENLLP